MDKKNIKIVPIIIFFVGILIGLVIGKFIPIGKDASKTNDTIDEQAESYESEELLNYEDYVTLGQYKGVQVSNKLVEVTEADIDTDVRLLVKNNGGLYETDSTGIISEDDQVEVLVYTLDVESTEKDDNFNEDLAQESTLVMGDENLPLEFAEMIGHGVGDIIPITVSEQNVTYKFKIKSVKKQGEPTDKFVAELGIEGVSTVEELRQDIREYQEAQHQEEYEATAKSNLLTAIYGNCNFSVMPDEYYEPFREILQSILDNTSQADENFDIDAYIAETYADDGVTTKEQFLDYYSKQNANLYAMCLKIANEENLKADLLSIYSNAADDWSNNKDRYASLKDFVESNDMTPYERAALQEAVADFLFENATKQ